MLQSFYKYIANELLIGYFRKNPLRKGSRYFMIIENEEHRNKLMEALDEVCDTITISGIYQGSSALVHEEEYNAHVIKPTPDSPSLIIAYDKTSTEDYLTTIRNSVGIEGGKYENYGIIYILSNSVLSSIITACQDLQSLGGPLHTQYIRNDIQEKAESVIYKDLEKKYLDKHLEKISEYISDGTCSLFDFACALAVLSDHSLSGHYNNLDFFNDKRVYDGTYKPSDSEIQERVEKNHDIFRRVSDIMHEDDEDDQLKLLQRFLDEKLSKKIVKSSDWKGIDFQEFLNSIESKATTANLELLDVKLQSEDLMTSMVFRQTGNSKKSSKNFIVVCDESNSIGQRVKATFNKDIKKSSSGNIHTYGQFLDITVQDELIKQTIGLNDNHHDFFMMKLPCGRSFFNDIERCFTINKRGEIIVNVPEEIDVITFGNGSNNLCIPLDGKVEWCADARLEVSVISDDDSDQIDFVVNFGSKEVKVILKLNITQSIPPAWPGTITGNYIDDNVVVDGEIHPVQPFWKQYLNWEQTFITNSCSNIRYVYNNLVDDYDIEYVNLNLPNVVQSALAQLYTFYNRHNTIPSLCKLTDELRALYCNYWESVVETIQAIPNSRCLNREEYDITKLGVVEKDGKIYLSPFHPILVAYTLEYDKQYDDKEESAFAKKLLSPFYLLPYIFYNSKALRPYTDKQLGKINNWLCYEGVNSKPQERTNDITTKMVWTKMDAFIDHFNYLFQDQDCPIIISTIGIVDDTNVIKGIVEYIKKHYATGVQKIELHEYVENIMDESFYEKLNRLDSVDAIARELESLDDGNKFKIESKGEYTSQEIIHKLFTRVSFFKHTLDEANNQIGYSHIAFYQMDTGKELIRQATSELRTELSFNGLISIPSTANKSGAYIIGYGTKDLKNQSGYVYPMATALNTLYANEEHDGSSVYSQHTCVAKRYKFSDSSLLNSIYENANWVTFINPEVDINFFYKQDLYVVHYTDQYTINAKYDSITVTKHIDQYENMLRKSYEKYALSADHFKRFNETMMDYFNCLNGSWMLNIVNKTENQIREKMSIVAASIAMLHFMKRNKDVLWIPISLEEILRVTGSIGLPQDYIFTKKSLGAKGAMSDDLLMIGLDTSNTEDLKLYLYPVEVKLSKESSMAEKAAVQVSKTFIQLKEHLFGSPNFTKNIYRTFFASQFLTNAEKLNANNLLADEEYAEIEKYRFELLNLNYTLEEQLPVKQMGNAAIVSFFSHASHSLSTSLVDNIPVCEVHFSEQECFQFVAEPENNHLKFLETGLIIVDDATMKVIENPTVVLEETQEALIELSEIDEEGYIDKSEVPIEAEIEEIKEVAEVATVNSVPTESTMSTSCIKLKVGYTQSGHREVVFEPNNTKSVSHPNMGIIGTMGTGKTQFARSIIAQLSKEGINNVGGRPVGVLVFDYKGDYKDKEFLDAVGGQCYKFNYPFNPLKLVVNDEVDGMNLPAITADRISDSFAKAYGLGLKQQSNIKQVIIETYADAGITKNPDTWNNPVPTMEHVIEKYFDTYDANDKAYALFDKLRDYTIFTTDNSNCVSLFEWLDSVRVIDLTLYPDDTKKVIVSLILDLFYAEMRQLGGSKQQNGFRELRAMIMVDEAHQFLKKDFNSFRSIISEGRMFGVGMILSTQNIGDFKTSKEDYSQFVLSWVIHHVNSISKSEIASIFGASDPNGERYMDFINRAKLFESVCKIGSRVDGIRDIPFFELVEEDVRFK